MWTVGVEVVLVVTQYPKGMRLVAKQHAISALGSDAAHEAFRERVRPLGVRGGVLTTSMPSAVNTASKDRVNFASPSRIRNRNAEVHSPRSITTLRACWVTQAAVGWALTPRMCTRRVAISMTNSTYSRRNVTVSR
jgi:hypothetical protein